MPEGHREKPPLHRNSDLAADGQHWELLRGSVALQLLVTEEVPGDPAHHEQEAEQDPADGAFNELGRDSVFRRQDCENAEGDEPDDRDNQTDPEPPKIIVSASARTMTPLIHIAMLGPDFDRGATFSGFGGYGAGGRVGTLLRLRQGSFYEVPGGASTPT